MCIFPGIGITYLVAASTTAAETRDASTANEPESGEHTKEDAGGRGRGCKVDSLKMGQADDNVAWSCFRTKAAAATAEALKPPANAAAASTETAGWALLISHKVGQPGEREEGEGKRGHGEEREI